MKLELELNHHNRTTGTHPITISPTPPNNKISKSYIAIYIVFI